MRLYIPHLSSLLLQRIREILSRKLHLLKTLNKTDAAMLTHTLWICIPELCKTCKLEQCSQLYRDCVLYNWLHNPKRSVFFLLSTVSFRRLRLVAVVGPFCWARLVEKKVGYCGVRLSLPPLDFSPAATCLKDCVSFLYL